MVDLLRECGYVEINKEEFNEWLKNSKTNKRLMGEEK